MKGGLRIGLAVLGLTAVLTGCRSGGPENYRELSDEERVKLERSARILVMQSKAVPEHLRSIFAEIPGHERIVYTGDRTGRAEYRWEIYDSPAGPRITQKDVNPFWVRVYAEGDLRDPSWKMTHSSDWAGPVEPAERPAVPMRSGQTVTVEPPSGRVRGTRMRESVRYRR